MLPAFISTSRSPATADLSYSRSYYALVWAGPGPSKLGRRNVCLVLMLVGLPLGASIEQQRYHGFSVANLEFESTSDGLTSVVDPLRILGLIVEDGSSGTTAHLGPVSARSQSLGRTFLVPVVATVPRSIWSDKPSGLGRILVEELDPSLAASVPNQSWAASYLGEWIYNFGPVIGLLFGSALTGRVIKRMDELMVAASKGPHRRSLAFTSACVILAVNMPTYYWGGFHTFATRGGYSALAVLALWKSEEIAIGRRDRSRPRSPLSLMSTGAMRT